MRKSCAVVALSLVFGWTSAAASDECKIGPVSRNYGGTKWLVYGCDDDHSMIVITAPGSPASPFLFTFHWESDGYHLAGVGTGNKKLTDAAFAKLKTLSQRDLELLLAEARHH